MPEQWFVAGKCSWFGGPDDDGVAPDEGLAFIHKIAHKPEVFLPEQPPKTTGLARRLDPNEFYIAMRWDYDRFPKEYLRGNVLAEVTNPRTGKSCFAHPVDWGPHTRTNRVADLSPGVFKELELNTDDEVEIRFPA
jgi:hypothetical protein